MRVQGRVLEAPQEAHQVRQGPELVLHAEHHCHQGHRGHDEDIDVAGWLGAPLVNDVPDEEASQYLSDAEHDHGEVALLELLLVTAIDGPLHQLHQVPREVRDRNTRPEQLRREDQETTSSEQGPHRCQHFRDRLCLLGGAVALVDEGDIL